MITVDVKIMIGNLKSDKTMEFDRLDEALDYIKVHMFDNYKNCQYVHVDNYDTEGEIYLVVVNGAIITEVTITGNPEEDN